MALHALGIVAPVSTTVGLRATNNQSDPTRRYSVQAIGFQVLRTNTDVVYVCDRANASPATGVGILVELPIAASNTVIPFFSIGNPSAVSPINVNEIFILPAVSGEGVRVLVMVT